jgi:hypothetical protein
MHQKMAGKKVDCSEAQVVNCDSGESWPEIVCVNISKTSLFISFDQFINLLSLRL